MKHVVVGLLALIWVFTVSPLRAQVGNNNPAGHAGLFNGQAGACGYDPYTGNATRSITDIAVAGSVGEYPLALVRTANSRAPSITGVFGTAGGWNHNYNWTMDDSPVAYSQNSPPTKYTVNFPDGRVETFRAVTWDSVYRVRPGNDTPQTTSAGIRERFLQLNLGNMYAYLILPDGGAIEFTAQQYNDPQYGRWWYTYHVTGIYDPYGLKTAIDSEVVGTIRRITRVTEPAGRYLQFTYDPNARRRITQITEYINGVARRSVQYYYSLGWLTSVVYYGNSAWTARYQYTAPNVPDLPMLLSTCDDPMYPGPMKRIAYEYKPGQPTDPNNPDGTRPVYGQLLRERYWDGVLGHERVGAMVSELTAGESPNITYKRKETRGDGVTRTFIYSGGGYVTWVPDFMSHNVQQHYDSTTKYIDYVVDSHGNRTDYIFDSIIGNITQIQFPLTQSDTPNQTQRPTVNYTYTHSYYLHTIQDESHHTTTIVRDPNNNRVTEIDYPDGGYESFPSYNLFNQVLIHRMVTAGTESFTYDGRGLAQTYRNPDNASGNPTARYQYDAYDRVSDVTDVLGTSLGDANHTTSYSYNLRGQLSIITLPNDNGLRHTITSWYNSDGTVSASQNEMYQTTSYTYDDYRRLKSVTPPDRGDGTGLHTTNYYYDANGTGDNYQYSDSNVTWVKLPSAPNSKRIQAQYDANRRKTSVTVAPGTGDAATTVYQYDAMGNLTQLTNPRNVITTTLYDERNRPYSISVGDQTTTITYDTLGRRKTITRPNGEVITNLNFDTMNRVLLQSATNRDRQNNTYNMNSQYAYYTPTDGSNAPVGLLKTFQDPHLYNTGQECTYTYDGMGRKRSLQYPLDSLNLHRTEYWTYDTAGRLLQFTNRAGGAQTFSYDGLNRMTGFTWNDGTPAASFIYDAASRLTQINNAHANISRAYWNDNSLRSETEDLTAIGGVARTVSYTYDADGNRATLTIPGFSFTYGYTNRNKVNGITDTGSNITSSFWYDQNGNVTQRNPGNGTSSAYTVDALDRVTQVVHNLTPSGTMRTFNYGYYPNSNDRKWTQRLISGQSPENNKGEVFLYDLADQVTNVQLDVASPNTASPGNPAISYDANGNRLWFQPAGWNDAYTVNNLNQYSSRNSNNATYDNRGNLSISPDTTANRLTCAYDGQNRVLSARKGGTNTSFAYDGLNRQVSRAVGSSTEFSTWDGWELVEDYHMAGRTAVADATYLYGATGLIKELRNNRYYYQDGSGSTALLADSTGHLLEWYRYDLQGAPIFYNTSDQQIGASAFNVRHLFTGQQWYQELGLYDMRNRFYSPDLGRFLQPDPIGFRGGNNLYRYCRNNPVTRWDPFGLQDAVAPTLSEGWTATVEVTGSPVPEPIDPGGTGAPSGGGGGGGGGEARSGGGSVKLTGITFSYGMPPRNRTSNTQQQPPGVMVPFDIYRPTTTAEFVIAGNIIEGGDTTDTMPAIDPIDVLSGGIAGLLRTSVSGVAAKGIYTPYGRALQATTTESQAALRHIRGGATVYKGGVLGRSQTSGSQFLSLEIPLNPGYAARYGIPPANANFDFILSGRVRPGVPLITRPAVGVAPNVEPGIEAVTTPGSFIIDSFYMPD